MSLYNGEIKRRFLDLYDNESTRKNYERILTKASDTEALIGKDLADFNIDEIKDVMFNLNPPSHISAQSYGRIITKYIEWGIEEGLRKNNINPLRAKEPSYFSQFIDNTKQYYLTESELRDVEIEIINPSDAACLRLIFEGVGGKNLSEIVNLKKKDINYNENTLTLIDYDKSIRMLRVEDRTLKYLRIASDTNIYFKNNGIENPNARNKNEQSLVDNEYVIRPVFTRIANPNGSIDPQVIYRRLRTVKRLLEYMKVEAVKYFTTTNIARSGMIYMAKNLIIRDGTFNKKQHYEEIMRRFKINTKNVLTQFLTEDLIYDMYGDDIENEMNNTHS